jgi:hypothetical protein
MRFKQQWKNAAEYVDKNYSIFTPFQKHIGLSSESK